MYTLLPARYALLPGALLVEALPGNNFKPGTLASLADGTPLVTAASHGKGLIVLFHVTANADWSNLPLSGLFVEMLRRHASSLPPGTKLSYIWDITDKTGKVAIEAGRKVTARLAKKLADEGLIEPKQIGAIGGSYGAGNYGMSGRAYGTRFTFIWPTAKIAVMGPKQMAGVMTIVQRAASARCRAKPRLRKCTAIETSARMPATKPAPTAGPRMVLTIGLEQLMTL